MTRLVDFTPEEADAGLRHLYLSGDPSYLEVQQQVWNALAIEIWSRACFSFDTHLTSQATTEVTMADHADTSAGVWACRDYHPPEFVRYGALAKLTRIATGKSLPGSDAADAMMG